MEKLRAAVVADHLEGVMNLSVGCVYVFNVSCNALMNIL